jgi:hypothetical protein
MFSFLMEAHMRGTKDPEAASGSLTFPGNKYVELSPASAMNSGGISQFG